MNSGTTVRQKKNTCNTAVGYFALANIIATAPSHITVGNSATSSYRVYANWSNISDGRYKKNIKENVPGLAFINRFKAVTYNRDAKGLDNLLSKNRAKKNEINTNEKALMDKALADKDKDIQTAQDVEKAA